MNKKQKTLHIGSEYTYIQHNKESEKDLEDGSDCENSRWQLLMGHKASTQDQVAVLIS